MRNHKVNKPKQIRAAHETRTQSIFPLTPIPVQIAVKGLVKRWKDRSRPFLIMTTDCESRVILGATISLEAPNQTKVQAIIGAGIRKLPKNTCP